MNSRWATRLSHPPNVSRHVQNTTECSCRRTFCAIKMTCSAKLVGLGWGEAKAHLILENTRKVHLSNLGGLVRRTFL